jgi:hypothetical protein
MMRHTTMGLMATPRVKPLFSGKPKQPADIIDPARAYNVHPIQGTVQHNGLLAQGATHVVVVPNQAHLVLVRQLPNGQYSTHLQAGSP